MRTMVIAAVFAGVVSVSRASAQVEEPVMFSAPFSFTVGDTTVPAGKYVIRKLDDQDNVLELTSASGGTGVFFVTEGLTAPVNGAPQTEVVFERSGDRTWLKEVWVQGDETGAEAASAIAAEKAEQRAANAAPREVVHVAAVLTGKTHRAAAQS